MDDTELARRLQAQFDQEASSEMAPYLPPSYRTPQKPSKLSVVSHDWETIDPTPDLHALFIEFNQTFFWGKLWSCEVRWSPRMTQCAGICRYSPRERFCTIGISIPLLKLRPRKDLVETLLHEMIHAYLFVTDNNDNHDGHGPEFHKHMYRINAATGANISVYHNFHDEVELYKQHWWRCNGPCTKRPPFYGFVKRSMNRAPGPNDRWWKQHENTCAGAFIKIKEPEGYGKKKGKENKKDAKVGDNNQRDIRTLFGSTSASTSNSASSTKPISKPEKQPFPTKSKSPSSKKPTPKPMGGRTTSTTGRPSTSGVGGGRGNIFGFGGTSFHSPGGAVGGGLKTAGKSGTYTVKPGWKTKDNSSAGEPVVAGGLSSNDDRPSLTVPSSSAVFGAGRTLGGDGKSNVGGAGTEQLSAREAARRKWAQIGQNNSSIKTTPKSSQNESKKLPKFSQENNANNSNHPKTSKIAIAACPVCNVGIPTDQINDHLDNCLQGTDLQSTAGSSCEKNDDVFNDSDDELFLEIFNSMEKTGESSVITISTSGDEAEDVDGFSSRCDDDEPLIKRRCKDESLDQDDQDLLTAFEDETDHATEEFACPVCGKLVTNLEMNSHLNLCLKL